MKADKNRSSKPSPADLEAAARLRQAWMGRPGGLTQEKMGVLLGSNQSAVSHYLRGRNALNFRALMIFADALGVDPTTIRSDLPEQALTAPAVSQPVGLDLARLAGLIATVEAAVKNAERVKLKIPITAKIKARLIVNLYADSGSELPTARAVAKELARILKAEEVTNEPAAT